MGWARPRSCPGKGDEAMDMEKLVSLCKRRGFIFPSSEIYGGINGFWDYGPLGVELKRNIKEAWWQDNVSHHDDTSTPRVPVGLPDDRPRLLDHHEPEGLGGVRTRRRVQRPDGRLPGDQGALSGRPALCLPLRPRSPRAKEGQPPELLVALAGGHCRGRAPSLEDRLSRMANKGTAPRQAEGVARADRRTLTALDDRTVWTSVFGPSATQPGTLDRAPPVQPDVRDERRRRRRRFEQGLPPPRDRPGHLRQLQERARHLPREAAVRDRPGRQELPQRDHAAELHLPLARVRADGDRVLLPPRRVGSLVRLLAEDAVRLVRPATASRATGSASATTTRTSSPSTPAPRPTSSTPSRSASASWRGSRTGPTTTSSST